MRWYILIKMRNSLLPLSHDFCFLWCVGFFIMESVEEVTIRIIALIGGKVSTLNRNSALRIKLLTPLFYFHRG